MVYIPDDLAGLIPKPETKPVRIMARPAKPDERKEVFLSNDNVVDDICTIFAALRIGFKEEQMTSFSSMISTEIAPLKGLLSSLGFFDQNNKIDPDLVRGHLTLPRSKAFLDVSKSWMESKEYFDLLYVPGLIFEGKWQSFPYKSRQTVLAHITDLQPDTWWNISTFISSFKTSDPEFLRQSNDYDNWYIRSDEEEGYLKGFKHWDQVEGRYLQYLINGPLFWFGLIDLAGFEKNGKAISFRLSKRSLFFFKNEELPGVVEESEDIYINSKLILDIPKKCMRTIRYHLSRFCEWEGMSQDNFRYRITTESLQNSQNLGLEVDQLLKLLQKHSVNRLSKNIIKAIKRWDKQGVEASIGQHLILRVHDPAILQELKASKSARFLGDSLSPTSVIVNPGAWEKVQEALGEIGYLLKIQIDRKKAGE